MHKSMSTCPAALHTLVFARSRPISGRGDPFIGVPDPTFTGWYVEGSWFFGGHKTYKDEGVWGRPVVNNPMFHGSGGWGAVQLVGKYDVLDQSDSQNIVQPASKAVPT